MMAMLEVAQLHGPHHEHDAGREQQAGGEKQRALDLSDTFPIRNLRDRRRWRRRRGPDPDPAGEALLDEVETSLGHRQTEVFPYQVLLRL